MEQIHASGRSRLLAIRPNLGVAELEPHPQARPAPAAAAPFRLALQLPREVRDQPHARAPSRYPCRRQPLPVIRKLDRNLAVLAPGDAEADGARAIAERVFEAVGDELVHHEAE